MNRRALIKNLSLALGSTISAPTLMAMSKLGNSFTSLSQNTSFSLSNSQQKIVAEIAEIIIPKTDTAGAKDVGVPAFIEMMLKDCYSKPEHDSFKAGLAMLEQLNFLEMNESEKKGALKYLEQDTKADMKIYQSSMAKKESPTKGLPFWRLIKELTLLGYFTSEAGIKSSFEYVQIPGKLELIKLKPNQKAYAY